MTGLSQLGQQLVDGAAAPGDAAAAVDASGQAADAAAAVDAGGGATLQVTPQIYII